MNQEQTSTIADSVREVPVAAPAHSSPLGSMHLPEVRARSITLPITPKSLILLVAGWLVLLVAINSVVSFYAGKPKLSHISPAPAGSYAKLSPDEERQANIDSIRTALDKYYESFGVYPSTSQINSMMFREGDPSFKQLNRQTYIDPEGRTALFEAKPTKNAYFYIPGPTSCDSSQIKCREYTVGSTLSTGEVYSQKNNN